MNSTIRWVVTPKETSKTPKRVRTGDDIGPGPCTVIGVRGTKVLIRDPDGDKFVIHSKRTDRSPWEVRHG